MYAVVAKGYTKAVYVDKTFQRKTNESLQKHATFSTIAAVTDGRAAPFYRRLALSWTYLYADAD